MKIDVNQIVKNYKGEPIEMEDPDLPKSWRVDHTLELRQGKTEVPTVEMSLADALERCLTQAPPEGGQGSKDDTVGRISLASKVYAARKAKDGMCEITNDEKTMAEKYAGSFFVPIVGAAVIACLDNLESVKEDKKK